MGMLGGGMGGRIGPNGVLLGPGGMGGPLASPAMGMGVGGMSPLMMLQPQLLANALLQGITANPQFAAMMRQAGFGRVSFERMAGGIVALHVGMKP
mgnify:CR=1 FL=1